MDVKMWRIVIIACICLLSDVKLCHCTEVEGTDKPQPKCPKQCECSSDFVRLHCKNFFKADGLGLSGQTKVFSLERDFIGPVLNGTFRGLTSLETIDLSYSKITFVQNGAFSGLSALKQLSLRGNEIQMLDEFMLKDNLLLEELDLSQNELYFLQDDLFRFLPNLRMLNVSYNMLISAKLGMRFQVTTRLATIDFSGNFIENVTVADFRTTQRWESHGKNLNFSSCGLKYIDPHALLELRNVEFLGLANNPNINIDNITEFLEALGTVTLKKLDLSYTNISQKINISHLTLENLGTLSVQELYLSGNGLSSIDENLLSYLNLRKLVASENDLTEIGEGIAKLTYLKYLDLSHNAISVVHELFADTVANLETLKLANNSLSNESGLNLERGTKLIEADLSSNRLETITVPRLPKLKMLNLAKNKINDMNGGLPLIGLDKLEILDVSDNKLTSLGSFMFRDSKNITRVDFSRNEINRVSHQAFIPECPKNLDLSGNALTKLFHFGWNHIDTIILNDNLITTIEPQAFFFLDGLKVLDLSFNNISVIDTAVLSHLTNLTELYLQGNFISQWLPIPEILAPLQSLRKIDLSFNNFTSFEFLPLPFLNNFELEEIRIVKNKIRVFSPYTFTSVKNLKVVDFSHNPFVCSCENVPLQDWAKETSVFIENQENFGYICSSPLTRGTKTLMTFETRTFECKRYLFYIVVFSSTGLACMLVAVSTAVICYLYRRRKKGKVEIEKKSEEVDLIGYEKMNEENNELEPVTPEDYFKKLRENYLKGTRSDTLIDVEFESPDFYAELKDKAKIVKKENQKKVKKEKTKSKVSKPKIDHQKMTDAKKLKYYAQLYDMLREKNPKPRITHREPGKQSLKKLLEALDKEYKKHDNKDEMKKMLKAMDHEYRKVQEKKKHVKPKNQEKEKNKRKKHRRSRDNRELIRMLARRQSRSVPDVLSYVNSLPRARSYYRDHPYMRVPIYHIDHMDRSRHGWARSLVDLPRVHRSTRDLLNDYPVLKHRKPSYERFLDEDVIPHGYHTVSPGRRSLMVDSRVMDRDRSRSQLERRLIREQLLADENLMRRAQQLEQENAARMERKLSRNMLVDDRSLLQRERRMSREQLLKDDKQREKLLLDERPIIEDKLFVKPVENTDMREGRISRQQSRVEEIQAERVPEAYGTLATSQGTILETKLKNSVRIEGSKSNENLSQWV